jgi:hypothetical protein
MVAGIWRVQDRTIQLAAFSSLSAEQRRAVANEAEQMAPFWTGEWLPTVWTDVWKLPGKW